MGTIRDPDTIRCLVSQVRQEIVDTVEALGTCSVAEMAEQVGRSPDGLYYHVRALVRAGLLEQRAHRAGARREEAVYGIRPRGGPLRLHYDPGDPDNVAAVRGVAGSMLRVAERDFEHGFDSGLAVCGGPERNLWAARRKGWLSPADVREVNRLLERLCALFEQGKAPERARLHVLSFVLAPVEARAGRRGSTPPGDDRR